MIELLHVMFTQIEVKGEPGTVKMLDTPLFSIPDKRQTPHLLSLYFSLILIKTIQLLRFLEKQATHYYLLIKQPLSSRNTKGESY